MHKKVVVNFTNEELKNLINDEDSCVKLHKSDYNLSLHPHHLSSISTSIKDVLNVGIAKYDKKLGGILLSYKNITIIKSPGVIVSDSFYIHISIEADFYIFKPEVGSKLRGIVNKKSKDHVGCLVHRLFNISVPRDNDDPHWSGNGVQIGEEVLLKVANINLDASLPYIRASFVSDDTKRKKKKSLDNLDMSDETYVKKGKKKHKKKSSEGVENEYTEDDSIPRSKLMLVINTGDKSAGDDLQTCHELHEHSKPAKKKKSKKRESLENSSEYSGKKKTPLDYDENELNKSDFVSTSKHKHKRDTSYEDGQMELHADNSVQKKCKKRKSREDSTGSMYDSLSTLKHKREESVERYDYEEDVNTSKKKKKKSKKRDSLQVNEKKHKKHTQNEQTEIIKTEHKHHKRKHKTDNSYEVPSEYTENITGRLNTDSSTIKKSKKRESLEQLNEKEYKNSENQLYLDKILDESLTKKKRKKHKDLTNMKENNFNLDFDASIEHNKSKKKKHKDLKKSNEEYRESVEKSVQKHKSKKNQLKIENFPANLKKPIKIASTAITADMDDRRKKSTSLIEQSISMDNLELNLSDTEIERTLSESYMNRSYENNSLTEQKEKKKRSSSGERSSQKGKHAKKSASHTSVDYENIELFKSQTPESSNKKRKSKRMYTV